MNYELLFTILNFSVLAGWLLLIFAPRWRATPLIASFAIPFALSAVYAFLMLSNLLTAEGSFFTLAGVRQYFSYDAVLLGGWVHYLVFDLFIGGWETRDSLRLGLPRAAVIPCLIFTFLLGPVGLLLYFTTRGVLKKNWNPVEV
jgi:hypothetical protein